MEKIHLIPNSRRFEIKGTGRGCMIQVNQKKQKISLYKRFPSWQFLIRDRLGIFALILFVLGLIWLIVPDSTLKGIGGILFGTGLTVVISRWNNREQAAKEANLR